MPKGRGFESEAQRRLFYAKRRRGEISQATLDRWEKETGGRKLPKKKGNPGAGSVKLTAKQRRQKGHAAPPKGYPKTKRLYADPKNHKYPIDTKKHVRAAWAYISKPKNSAMYSTGELRNIKARIKARAKKLGIEIAA